MSAQDAHAGPIERSLKKNVAHNKAPSAHTCSTQFVANRAMPAHVKPISPLSRLPHLRLPVRRMMVSDTKPPPRQANTPNASGNPDSHCISAEDKCRVFWR